MTKITEASNLGALGVPDKIVGAVHKRHKLPHDSKFEELKTKSQMKVKLKDGKLIIGISPEGKIASLGKDSGWGASKSVYLTIDGKEEYARNVTDALNLVPGRGWKWFASDVRGGDYRGGDWQKEREAKEIKTDDTLIAFSRLLDRVYAKKIKADAREYASDVREFAIKLLDRDAENMMEPDSYKQDPSYSEMRDAQKNFKLLHMIANSDDPFMVIAKRAYDGYFSVHRLSQYLESVIKRYDNFGTTEETVAIFLRNEPLAAQKIVKYLSNELKKLRDSAIGAKGEDAMAQKMSLPKVKKAWESYQKSGKTKPLS